ncbi:hypothetical protein D3C73_1111930 [compost metagenome]
MHYLFDRGIQKLRYVIADFIVYARREVAFHLRQLRFHIFDDIVGITTIILLEYDGSRGMPIQIRIDIKKFTAQFDFAHIFQFDVFTFRICADDNIFIFFGGIILSFVRQYIFQGLSGNTRALSQSARPADDTLLSNSFHDLIHRQAIGTHPVRI